MTWKLIIKLILFKRNDDLYGSASGPEFVHVIFRTMESFWFILVNISYLSIIWNDVAPKAIYLTHE